MNSCTECINEKYCTHIAFRKGTQNYSNVRVLFAFDSQIDWRKNMSHKTKSSRKGYEKKTKQVQIPKKY